MESFAQFTVDGSRVYGMVHTPDTEPPPRGWPSVVFVHGFTGHRAEAQRLFVRCSRLLAERGIASLRFDCRGSGESHGEFSDVTVGREVEDTVAAAAYLRRQPHVDPLRVMLLGFSMGGLVATLAARDVQAHRLLLWAPALPELWLARLPGGQLPATVADVGGWPVSRAFFQDMLRQRPLDAAARWGGVAHVIHGDADDVCPPDYGVRYARALGCDATGIPGGTHTFATLDATELLYRETLRFLSGG